MRRAGNPPAEERLAAMGAPRIVVELVAAAPEDVKPLLFNAYRKDPGVSAEKLLAILDAASKKREPLPIEEELVAELTDSPVAAKWIFVELMKHRDTPVYTIGQYTYPGYHVGRMLWSFNGARISLRAILDWAAGTRTDLRRYTLEQAFDASYRWHSEIKNLGVLGLSYEPTKKANIVAAWPDGWTMQRIASENDVYTEGELMQHCLRKDRNGPAYWRNAKVRQIFLYSLRDERNNPHVTIEIRVAKLEQLYGKQNKRPEWKYMERVLEWLPGNAEGRLDLSGYRELTSLPGRFTKWGGSLYLCDTAIKELPAGLDVTGSIYASGSALWPGNIPARLRKKVVWR